MKNRILSGSMLLSSCWVFFPRSWSFHYVFLKNGSCTVFGVNIEKKSLDAVVYVLLVVVVEKSKMSCIQSFVDVVEYNA